MIKNVLLGVAVTFLVISCSANKSEKPQEESGDVQTFAESFARFVKANQIDSIKAVYPTANFDSVVSIGNNSISITESGAGLFKIYYTPDKWIDVKVSTDGKMYVENSRGIAAFPEEKYQTAKNTGMLSDSINDVKTQELLNDEAYFKWLKNRSKKSKENALTLKAGKAKMGRGYGEGLSDWTMNCTVTNNLPVKIKGDQYKIAYTLVGAGEEGNNWKPSYFKRSISGKDIEPNQSITITISDKGDGIKNPTIVMQLPKNEDHSISSKPRGNQYQEYLEKKK